MSAANGETLVIVINRLLLRLDARGVSANEIVACIKPLIADSEAKACAELRAVFPKILAALGNGACCAPDVSVEFIKAIPNEVAGVVAQLRAEVKESKERERVAIASSPAPNAPRPNSRPSRRGATSSCLFWFMPTRFWTTSTPVRMHINQCIQLIHKTCLSSVLRAETPDAPPSTRP